jgi:serine phosphatase RsbU (regulator of sigma subunit)
MAGMDPLRRLAESTEELAVREKFDAHNVRYGRVASLLLLLFATPLFFVYLTRVTQVPFKFAGAALLFSSALAMFLTATRRTGLVRALTQTNPSIAVVGLAVGSYSGLITITYRDPNAATIIATLGPWIMAVFWMPFARRLAVHAIFILLLIVAIEIGPGRLQGRAEFYAPAISSTIFALLLGGFVSRRARKSIVAEWSERHAQAIEQLRMRDELEFARKVQLSMLPEGPPPLPWLDIAASSIPATEVGGDYYDYFQFGDEVAIVSGDVAGHGFASGIVLATLRSGFTLLRESLGRPASVLTRLHELIEETSRTRMLTTAAVLAIDPLSRRARIASAGHPPVMFRSNGTVRSIELFGPPLGVRLPIKIAETEIALSEGDVFVMHSDGIYETSNHAGELYGLERLSSLIAAHPASTAADLRDAILRDVAAFRGDRPQDDDVTLVVVGVRP